MVRSCTKKSHSSSSVSCGLFFFSLILTCLINLMYLRVWCSFTCEVNNVRSTTVSHPHAESNNQRSTALPHHQREIRSSYHITIIASLAGGAVSGGGERSYWTSPVRRLVVNRWNQAKRYINNCNIRRPYPWNMAPKTACFRWLHDDIASWERMS